jgi:hypothetical protein
MLHGRAMRLTNGNALAARLVKSAADVGVPMIRSTAARGLVVEGGRVIGITVESSQGRRRILARHGVVLACGGFPLDMERRRELFPHALTGEEHWSAARRMAASRTPQPGFRCRRYRIGMALLDAFPI